jgi:glycosyltransferase involved in cell wall biosynthesis
MHVYVLMPCWNEVGSIDSMVATIDKAFADHPEFAVSAICVDDGSQDGTWQQSRRRGMRHATCGVAVGGMRFDHHHQGKAHAQSVGLRHVASSPPGLVVLMDSDGQHAPALCSTLCERA